MSDDTTTAAPTPTATPDGISERRATQRHAAEQEVRAALELMPQLVWTTTPDGYHDYFNERWYVFTGMPRPGDPVADAEGWNWKTYLHPDDYARTVAVWERCLATGAPYEIEYRFREVSTNAYRWFLGRALPMRKASGEIVRWFGTCTDIHEQRLTTARLATANMELEARSIATEQARADAENARAEAEAANRAKTDFLSAMSHELRTPLNAIGGHTQLIDMGLYGSVTDEQRGALARVIRAERHLLRLVDDLLNFARLGSGQVEYDIAAVQLQDVVADVGPMIEPQLAAKGLSYEVLLPEAPILVAADRIKLVQVLLNLLSNACKFTPVGGRVTVEVRRRVTHPHPDGIVYLCVADTGIGIPEGKLDAVFEPFVRVSSVRTVTEQGTGLGLSISRDLARGMGGDLRARSTPGVSTTFTVTLRCA